MYCYQCYCYIIFSASGLDTGLTSGSISSSFSSLLPTCYTGVSSCNKYAWIVFFLPYYLTWKTALVAYFSTVTKQWWPSLRQWNGVGLFWSAWKESPLKNVHSSGGKGQRRWWLPNKCMPSLAGHFLELFNVHFNMFVCVSAMANIFFSD